MADDNKPRSNRGKYNEANYSPTRRAFIEMARSRGLTSAADMEKYNRINKTSGASRGKVSEEVIDIPDPVPSLSMDDLSPTEKYRKNYEDIFGRKEKKAKGGLVGRGQGKAIKIKTTKFY